MGTRVDPAGTGPAGQESAEKRRRLIGYAGVAAVVVAGVSVGAIAASITDQASEETAPARAVFLPSRADQVGVSLDEAGCSDVEEPAIQQSRIIQVDEQHPPYTSTPPTSGPHYLGALSAGIYWIAHDPEAVVANLAEGDVVVWHTGFDTRKEQDELKGLFVLFKSNEIVAVSGEDLGLEQPIVLTAWGKLQECEKFSGEAIADFFEKYRGLGPGF
jgi:hypothetical protein